MKLATHIGYDVYNLEASIQFYTEILGAKLDFKNDKRKSASLLLGHGEVNLFEREGFGGYHQSILRSMHIGFQAESIEQVDAIYQRASKDKKTVFHAPYKRFDGDYTFFIQDPDGMQLEIYCGDHHLDREAANE
jgi:catechol 2,3-dioxygenase-like lactoylglutathione lyase family enzyme